MAVATWKASPTQAAQNSGHSICAVREWTGSQAGVAMADWIKGAIKRSGALHRDLGVPRGKKIPPYLLAEAAKRKGTVGRRARLAEMLGGMHRG